jgi:hypothetical protein
MLNDAADVGGETRPNRCHRQIVQGAASHLELNTRILPLRRSHPVRLPTIAFSGAAVERDVPERAFVT